MNDQPPVRTTPLSGFSWRESTIQALPAIILAGFLLLPFLDKAYTTDDTFFLLQAEHLRQDPLHPSALEMVWMDHREHLSKLSPNGPVNACLLLPTVLCGGREWVAHLTMFLLVIVALIAMTALTCRLGMTSGEAQAAGIMLITMPAVLGMASTAMPDIPALAFSLLGLERFLAYCDERAWHQGLAAGGLMVLALLTRFHCLALVGIGLLFYLGNRPYHSSWPTFQFPFRDYRIAAVMLGVVFAASGLLWLLRDPSDASAGIAAAARWSQPSQIPFNLISFFAHLVFALPLAIPWLIIRRRQIPWRAAAAAGMVTAVFLLASGRWPKYGIAIPLTAAGAAVCLDAVRDGWQRRDWRQLVLTAWLGASLPAVIYLHFPPKYLVISAPAIVLLLLHTTHGWAWPKRLAVLGGTCLVSSILGLLIITADARLTELGRKAAQSMIAANVEAGKTVWYVGSWGAQWYAQQSGAKIFTLEPPYPQPGDLVVSRAATGALSNVFGWVHVNTLEDTRAGGRIMDASAGAGFFSNAFGVLPWSWSSQPIERFDLWVQPPATGPAANLKHQDRK